MIQQIINEDYPQLQEIRDSLLKVINHLQSKGPEAKSDLSQMGAMAKENPNKFKSCPKSLTKIYHTTEQSSSHMPSTSNEQAQITAPANDQPARQLKYILCEEAHLAKSCTKYSDCSARVKRLDQIGRYGRCTCRHKTVQCNFNLKKCYLCKRGFHHQVLCDNVM